MMKKRDKKSKQEIMCENTRKYNILKKVRKSVAFATKSYPHKLTSYPHSYPHIHKPHHIILITI